MTLLVKSDTNNKHVFFCQQDIDPDKQDSGDNDEKEVSGLIY